MGRIKLPVIEDQSALPIEVAAELCDVPLATFRHWQKEEGRPPRNEDRTVPARDLGKWIRKVLITKTRRNQQPWLPDHLMVKPRGMPPVQGLGLPVGDENSRTVFERERARKEAALADAAEMKNAERSGQWIEVHEVSRAWSTILTRVKARMMKIPYTAALKVTGETDMDRVRDLLAETVKDALIELAGDWQSFDDDPDEDYE